MSCLEATFTLTPQSPLYSASPDSASLWCWGTDCEAFSPTDLSSLYASNRFYFNPYFACDPDLDYTQWANRKKARYIDAGISLQGYASAHKQSSSH